MTPETAPSSAEQMLSLTDIVASLKRGRRMVYACALLFCAAAVLYAVFSQPLYTATIVVQPVEHDQGGALSALASRFGAAASLAGIDLSGGGSDKESYLATLRSRDLALTFIEKNGLLPYLFPKRWNEKSRSWADPRSGLVGRTALLVSGALAWLSGDQGQRDLSGMPSSDDAYHAFDDMTDIRENDTTGMVSVSFEYPDPVLAARWANEFVAFANDAIRTDAVNDASRAYDFLGKKADETTFAGLKDSIYRLMESQLETITLANARQDYAFKVIDPARVPGERSHPKRALIVILALFAGVFVGALIALAKDLMGTGAPSGVRG